MTKPNNNNNNNDTAGADRLKNTRWEAFCVHYTGKHRRNGAAAYRAAGYKPKTPEVATVCAIALLAKPNIQRRCQRDGLTVSPKSGRRFSDAGRRRIEPPGTPGRAG